VDHKLTATEISWPRASTRVGRRAVLSLIWVEKRHEIARPYSRSARASDRRAGDAGRDRRLPRVDDKLGEGDGTNTRWSFEPKQIFWRSLRLHLCKKCGDERHREQF
jgi:hypothetical protein